MKNGYFHLDSTFWYAASRLQRGKATPEDVALYKALLEKHDQEGNIQVLLDQAVLPEVPAYQDTKKMVSPNEPLLRKKLSRGWEYLFLRKRDKAWYQVLNFNPRGLSDRMLAQVYMGKNDKHVLRILKAQQAALEGDEETVLVIMDKLKELIDNINPGVRMMHNGIDPVAFALNIYLSVGWSKTLFAYTDIVYGHRYMSMSYLVTSLVFPVKADFHEAKVWVLFMDRLDLTSP